MSQDKIIQLFPLRGASNSAHSAAECDRPVVYTDDQPRDVLQNMLTVIEDANDPTIIFRRSGRLVCLVTDLDGEGAPVVPLSKGRLFKLLIEKADWRKRTTAGEGPSSPPSRIMDAVLEEPHESIPELDAVTTVPVFGRDFDLVDRPGYHADQHLYFHDEHGLSGAIAARLDLAEARGVLVEPFHDFPFAEQAGLAHAVALTLLPFVRGAVRNGGTPLHIIEAATPGSGKGRLADIVSIIATGEPCKPTTLGASNSENAKKLTSLLLAGTLAGCPIILLDNVPQNRILDDSTLASVLTTTRPTDRLLGGNRMAALRNQAVWILTANNLRCTTEISRRSVRIRIDPQTDRPWLRKDFRHENLLAWTRQHRPRLVQACVSLVLAWIEEGSPRWQGTPLGSFEEWSAILGGILDVSEIPGFLENIETTYADADIETEEWRALTRLWWERFKGVSVKASDLHDLCLRNELLAEVLGFGGQRSQESRLGRALNRNVGRVFGEFQIGQEHASVHNSARYMLKPVKRRSAVLPDITTDETT